MAKQPEVETKAESPPPSSERGDTKSDKKSNDDLNFYIKCSMTLKEGKFDFNKIVEKLGGNVPAQRMRLTRLLKKFNCSLDDIKNSNFDFDEGQSSSPSVAKERPVRAPKTSKVSKPKAEKPAGKGRKRKNEEAEEEAVKRQASEEKVQASVDEEEIGLNDTEGSTSEENGKADEDLPVECPN